MDQRCTVGQKGYTGRRSLEEGAVDKLLVGELGVEGVQQDGGQQDRHNSASSKISTPPPDNIIQSNN